MRGPFLIRQKENFAGKYWGGRGGWGLTAVVVARMVGPQIGQDGRKRAPTVFSSPGFKAPQAARIVSAFPEAINPCRPAGGFVAARAFNG